MPSGPGPIADEHIADIAAQIPPPIATFLLTCRRDVGQIIRQHEMTRTNTLQLVDRLPAGALGELRRALPGVGIVQVIHVTGEESIDEAVDAAAHAHAILLDSGNPKLAVKELGGTGRVHDWAISRKIREAIPVPLFLAGGLTAGNVAEAVRRVEPFGVDLCSGVRSGGALDPEKLSAFMAALPR
jgi:phosphoribosylanthranilate isomerase